MCLLHPKKNFYLPLEFVNNNNNKKNNKYTHNPPTTEVHTVHGKLKQSLRKEFNKFGLCIKMSKKDVKVWQQWTNNGDVDGFPWWE